MNHISKIQNHYIHKSIFLPNNTFILQLKDDTKKELPDLIIIFKECLTVDDLRLADLKIEDTSIQEKLSFQYISMARTLNKNPDEFKQFILFDKKNEELISTGVKKRSVLNVIYKEYEITDDIYSYKEY